MKIKKYILTTLGKLKPSDHSKNMPKQPLNKNDWKYQILHHLNLETP